jgi:hypothetical protein
MYIYLCIYIYIYIVGTMANLVKAAIKGGHPNYVPIDSTIIANVVPPYVEPGRLDARFFF